MPEQRSGFLFLIGARGSGKSTTGRALATSLSMRFCDLDEEIESASGMEIREIFSQRGELAFRELEHQALAQTVESKPGVVATGGGIILSEDNRSLMQSHGLIVWLKGTVDTLLSRVETDPNSLQRRPSLLKDSLTPRDEMMQVLSSREPIYRELANLEINTDGKAPEVVSDLICQWLAQTKPQAGTLSHRGSNPC